MKLTAAMMIAVAGACGTALADPNLYPGKPMPITSVRPLGAEHLRAGGNAVMTNSSSRYTQTVFDNSTTVAAAYYSGGGLPGFGYNYFFGGQWELNPDAGVTDTILTGHTWFFSGAGGGTADDFDFVLVYYSGMNDFIGYSVTATAGASTFYVLYGGFTGVDLSAGLGYFVNWDLASIFPDTGGIDLPGSQGVYLETYFCEPGTVSVGDDGSGNYNSTLGMSGVESFEGSLSPFLFAMQNSSTQGGTTTDAATYTPGFANEMFVNDDGDFTTQLMASDNGWYWGAGVIMSDGASFQSSSVHCPADFNDDGFPDFFDFNDFVTAFEAGC